MEVEMGLNVAENRVVHSTGTRGSLQRTRDMLRIAHEGNRLALTESSEVVDVLMECEKASPGKPCIVVEPQRRAS
jgi:hypothetical protein